MCLPESWRNAVFLWCLSGKKPVESLPLLIRLIIFVSMEELKASVCSSQ